MRALGYSLIKSRPTKYNKAIQIQIVRWRMEKLGTKQILQSPMERTTQLTVSIPEPCDPCALERIRFHSRCEQTNCLSFLGNFKKSTSGGFLSTMILNIRYKYVILIEHAVYPHQKHEFAVFPLPFLLL